jgi:hypothetical protein
LGRQDKRQYEDVWVVAKLPLLQNPNLMPPAAAAVLTHIDLLLGRQDKTAESGNDIECG